jgi:uncharacterized protein (TIGR03435 family)
MTKVAIRVIKGFGKSLLVVEHTVIAAVVLCLMSQSVSAQAMPDHAQTPKQSQMAFDVASVRESASDAPARNANFLLGMDKSIAKGGLFSANAPLVPYIFFAYNIADLSQYPTLSQHLPNWAQTDLFDIEARAEGNPTIDQMRLMMQTLLADRFKLVVHVDRQQLPGYALVLIEPGKVGSQLKPHSSDVPCLDRPEKPIPVADGTSPPPYFGGDAWRVNGQLHVRMVDATMEQIASFLGGAAGIIGGLDNRSIFDKTGLSGRFDLDLQFVMEKNGPPPVDTDSQAEGAGPTFTRALKDQLGLKLIKQTGSVDVLIIDHVEKPSEN